MRPVPNVPPAMDGRRDSACDSLAASTSTAPMSCFITTEAALETASEASSPCPAPRFLPTCARRKRSLEFTGLSGRSRLPSPSPTTAGESIASLSSSALDLDLAPGTPHLVSHSPLAAPAMTGLSGSASAISSASSRRHSTTASSPSRARPRSTTSSSDGQARADSHPQLIMPSLAVPQRRPFSEAGRSIGKLRVLVAGQHRVGKTSLIQSVARSCEHIVHMDPIPPSKPGVCNEVYASTRPRPWWQIDWDCTTSRRRRRSSAGELLDRNLCFVDGPSIQGHPSTPLPEKNYVDGQLLPLLERPLEDADLWSILSSGSEPIVDAVLYLTSVSGLEKADIECIRALQDKTNVIPLLARSDELDSETIVCAKQNLAQALLDNGLECFSFINPNSALEPIDVFAVSNATQSDHDIIDASILMSSGYVQPLVATELDKLLDLVLSADGSAWLRHSAASKCIRWRRDHGYLHAPQQALMLRDPSKRALTRVLTANPFIQHGSWTQVEVSNWAQCLRQSLETERLHHYTLQQLARDENAPKGVRDLVMHQDNRKRRKKGKEPANLTHQDPLGLLHITSHLRRNGQVTVELLASVGILGCFGAWLAGPEWRSYQGLRRLPWEVVARCLS